MLFICAGSARSSGHASTSGSHEESSVNLKGGQTLFVWGSKSSLQPQGSLQWPLWLHPRSPGLFTFHCVWYYEPSSPVDGMKFRSVSISHWHQLEVHLTIPCYTYSRAPTKCMLRGLDLPMCHAMLSSVMHITFWQKLWQYVQRLTPSYLPA